MKASRSIAREAWEGQANFAGPATEGDGFFEAGPMPLSLCPLHLFACPRKSPS